MKWMFPTSVILLLACTCAAAASEAPGNPIPCEIGSYAMADGSKLDIAAGAEGKLRWRMLDGRTGALTPQGKGRWTSTLGWLDRADGHRVTFSDCKRGEIRFDDLAGKRETLIQIDTRFQGSGVELAGRLTLPPGQARVPIVVLIHGAEHSSARSWQIWTCRSYGFLEVRIATRRRCRRCAGWRRLVNRVGRSRPLFFPTRITGCMSSRRWQMANASRRVSRTAICR